MKQFSLRDQRTCGSMDFALLFYFLFLPLAQTTRQVGAVLPVLIHRCPACSCCSLPVLLPHLVLFLTLSYVFLHSGTLDLLYLKLLFDVGWSRRLSASRPSCSAPAYTHPILSSPISLRQVLVTLWTVSCHRKTGGGVCGSQTPAYQVQLYQLMSPSHFSMTLQSRSPSSRGTFWTLGPLDRFG